MQDKEIKQALQEQDEINNALTMDPVNRRNAFVLANSKTGKMIRPNVYSNKTVLRLLKANNPRDPFTRKPLVQKKGVDGAVMAIRAPKFVRKIIQSKNPSKIPLSKKETRVKTAKDEKRKTKRIKVTMYLAEGKGSYKHGCRINNDPFVTPWHKVRRMILVMVVNDLETKRLGKFHGIYRYRDFTKEELISNITRKINFILTKKAPVVPIFDEKGVYKQHFYLKMFEPGHKSMMTEHPRHMKEKTLKSIEKALESPRSKTVGTPLPIPSSTGN